MASQNKSMAKIYDGISSEKLLEWYHSMVRIRRFEELAAKAYTQRKILGFCHLYIGQEAIAVGATAALEDQDYIVTAYREHGQILARGASSDSVMAELFGKKTGITSGVGGSMHMSSKELNFFGGYGIVGGHIPLAIGAAFASQYRGENRVALCYFGDGAAQQGAFFESLAMAQLWSLPVIFLCENNAYAMGTSIERQSFLTDMSKRGDGVGMKGWRFQGFDVCEVYQNVSKAVEHARSGKGPVIIEAATYRYRGHSMSDPAKYRQDGELDAAKEQDGISNAAHILTSLHGVDEATLKSIREDVDKEIKEAVKRAEKADPPSDQSLYKYTYAET